MIRLIRTAFAVGIVNVIRVVWYRAQKKSGYLAWRSPVGHTRRESGLLVFDGGATSRDIEDASSRHAADRLLTGRCALFGGSETDIRVPPDWHANQVTAVSSRYAASHWSRIPDFDPELGDIKTVWELSRFSWVLLLARAGLSSGNEQYVHAANAWIVDWIAQNPVNVGPNWMSGQEVAIRLVHVLIADALLRNDSSPQAAMEEFVANHCARVALTLGYAVAQDNNHVTSEAAGLFIGGAWLGTNARQPALRKQGARWHEMGRSLIEKSVPRLVMEDGTFSQYSVTYHRLMLDTLCIVEWWRRRSELPPFSEIVCARLDRATRWLFEMIDCETGDAPNIGANDGALVYPLCTAGHRDFRPTVQMAGALFCNQRFFAGEGRWNEPCDWLGIDLPTSMEHQQGSRVFTEGGFALLRHPSIPSTLMIRIPVFRFRPSQSDAMHVDLWKDGVNILRDGGSFSYAADSGLTDYFSGVRSHNTVQFDDRDQMPRVGRFLFGQWLKTSKLEHFIEDDRRTVEAAYSDHRGCRHERRVDSTGSGWTVVDTVAGPFQKAVIRWRLCPELEWSLEDESVRATGVSLTVSSDADIEELVLGEGQESRYYLEATSLPMLEVRLGAGVKTVTTRIELV